MKDPFEALGVDVDQPARMPIVWPGDVEPMVEKAAGTEAYLEFLPFDSDVGRKLQRANFRDSLRKGFRQKSRAEILKEAEQEDPVDSQVEQLVALCTGWHLVDKDGAAIDLPFSKSNAEKLFASPKTGWLRRQAWAWVNNEANFMQRSSTTSSSSPSKPSAAAGTSAAAAASKST